MHRKTTEVTVGIFMVIAVAALVFLAFSVSGLTSFIGNRGYTISAVFNNVGSLKPRAPVSIAGVNVGEVVAIHLDPKTFYAVVTLHIHSDIALATDTSASILTAGLLGANYINLSPGYNKILLHQDAQIALKDTHSALILEKLISKFL
ncbi:MAG: outer membrane lipid asymmetry maintenance protein MlaD [Gammaproteobacteria bacterium]|nr:outer membrane lipid asymmetry maintenance protein MlaD [Gammaproteobacteria bacterium]